jgi:hypothetical protein
MYAPRGVESMLSWQNPENMETIRIPRNYKHGFGDVTVLLATSGIFSSLIACDNAVPSIVSVGSELEQYR